jgi:hypothetical protein
MCDDGGHRAWVQGVGKGSALNWNRSGPCRVGTARGEQSKAKNFLNGTELPISLKTKGRGGRFRETKLPFAPSAAASARAVRATGRRSPRV